MDKRKKPDCLSDIEERIRHRHNRRRVFLMNISEDLLPVFSKRIIESDKKYSLFNPTFKMAKRKKIRVKIGEIFEVALIEKGKILAKQFISIDGGSVKISESAESKPFVYFDLRQHHDFAFIDKPYNKKKKTKSKKK